MNNWIKVKVWPNVFDQLFTGCGNYFKRPSGRFQSPNFPNAYPPNTDCDWYIETAPGTRVKVVIYEYDIEGHTSGPHQECTYDALNVSSSENQNKTVNYKF